MELRRMNWIAPTVAIVLLTSLTVPPAFADEPAFIPLRNANGDLDRRTSLGSRLPLVAFTFDNAGVNKADSGAVRRVTVQEDFIYGRVQGAALLADIAYPESLEPLPAIISVHGGRWVSGHKRDASTINVRQWAGFGFFAMSIDYRLKGCSPAPACYQDLQCAIRFVHAHAKEFRIDTKRIFLIGQSAGGHLVSLAATWGDGDFPRT